MHPTEALSMFFGSVLIIILIFAELFPEYANKYSGERRRKKTFCSLLAISLALMIIDIIFSLIDGSPALMGLILSCLSLFLVICILISFRAVYKKIALYTVLLLAAIYAAGLFTDILTGDTKLIWPCISALFLYTYFAIVQNETKLDNLTKLGNKYSFHEFVDKVSKSKTDGSWVVAMVDIDDIRKINNTYGHLEGDIALVELAEVIRSNIRDTDFAARYDDDEFVIVTKAEYGIEELLKKIKEELSGYNEKNDKPYKISISYGFDVYNAGKSIEEFLIHLDELTKKHRMDHRRTGDGGNS
jgi:diguanylate cyclase (GGDEF)-like protein